MVSMSSQPTSKDSPLVKLLGVVLFLVAVVWGIRGCDRREEQRRAGLSDQDRVMEDLELPANRLAQDTVSKYLKHPLDARFSKCDVARNSGGNSFTATGNVVAPNDLGGRFTSDWKVVLGVENGVLGVVSCEIDQKVVFLDWPLLDRLTRTAATAPQRRDTLVPTRGQSSTPRLQTVQPSEAVPKPGAKPTPARPSPRSSAAPDDPESRAMNLLGLADNLLEAGKTEAAMARYQSILDTYPKTKAAASARDRMDGRK